MQACGVVCILIPFLHFAAAFGATSVSLSSSISPSSSRSYLASEARIVKLQIIRHLGILFDYPFHWDHQIPLFLRHGDKLRLMFDLVHYDPEALGEVVVDGLRRADFKLSWRAQNKNGQTKFFSPAPSSNIRWINCPWPPDGELMVRHNYAARISTPSLMVPPIHHASPHNGQASSSPWAHSFPSISSACAELEFHGEFVHAGVLSFTTGKYRSTMAIENAHDWKLAQASDLGPAEKAVRKSDLLPEDELINYQHFVATDEASGIGEGEWVFIYGLRFWRPPQMHPPWRPYTMGHWSYSPYGLVWRASTHFGRWAEHYGVWRWHKKYGLVAQLHYVWQPAPVTFYGHTPEKFTPAWIAWRAVVPYLFKIKNRTYFPYRLGEKFGFRDYPTLANRPWPPNEVVDYVMVAPEDFTHEPLRDVDQSLRWINNPAGRDAILRPQDQMVHFYREVWGLVDDLPMQAIEDDLDREDEESEEEEED